MPNKRTRSRLKFSAKDKKIIAQYQNQADMLGNFFCKKCGRSFPLDILQVDHIKPISKGGSDQPSNLRLLCPTCNRKKGSKISKIRQQSYPQFKWF